MKRLFIVMFVFVMVAMLFSTASATTHDVVPGLCVNTFEWIDPWPGMDELNLILDLFDELDAGCSACDGPMDYVLHIDAGGSDIPYWLELEYTSMPLAFSTNEDAALWVFNHAVWWGE